MAITVVLRADTNERVATVNSNKDLHQYNDGNYNFVTKATFTPIGEFQTWDQLRGKPEKRVRDVVALTGNYSVEKPFPPIAEDHPKFPIWKAIAENTSVEAAKEACPKELPSRKSGKGKFSFASEFRYFLRTGHVKLS